MTGSGVGVYKKRGKTPLPQGNKRTRNDYKENFEITRPRLTLRKKSPAYRGKKLWNGLPKGIQTAETKEKFKLMVKRKLETNMKGKRLALLKRRRKRKPP